MSRPLPAFAAAVRRRLLARPGITALPVCGACGRQVQPRHFGKEFCQSCESERLEASEYFQRLNDETDWPVLPAPGYPMFDCPEAARPFLPDDAEDLV